MKLFKDGCRFFLRKCRLGFVMPIFFVALLLSGCAKISAFSEKWIGVRAEKIMRPATSKNATHDDLVHATESVNATYYFLLSQMLSGKNKSDESLKALERVKGLDANSSFVHYALAKELLKKGDLTQGVEMAKKAVEMDDKNRDAKLLLANLYATAKKYDQATVLFREIIKLDPDDEESMLYLALLEIEQKKWTEAYGRLKEFIGRNPDSALAYFYLGRLEQERGNDKAAEAAYVKAVDIRPGFVQAGTYLGFLQEKRGDVPGAVETYSWLANLTDSGNYFKKLGHIFLEQKDYPHALESFENFQRVEPSDLNISSQNWTRLC